MFIRIVWLQWAFFAPNVGSISLKRTCTRRRMHMYVHALWYYCTYSTQLATLFPRNCCRRLDPLDKEWWTAKSGAACMHECKSVWTYARTVGTTVFWCVFAAATETLYILSLHMCVLTYVCMYVSVRVYMCACALLKTGAYSKLSIQTDTVRTNTHTINSTCTNNLLHTFHSDRRSNSA